MDIQQAKEFLLSTLSITELNFADNVLVCKVDYSSNELVGENEANVIFKKVHQIEYKYFDSPHHGYILDSGNFDLLQVEEMSELEIKDLKLEPELIGRKLYLIHFYLLPILTVVFEEIEIELIM